MKQYINLLEEEELHYHSAASNNPVLKFGAVAIVLIVVAGTAWSIHGMRSRILHAQALETNWSSIEGRVKRAETLADELNRMERGLDTLHGWHHSRYQWPELLGFLQDELPGDPGRFQFLRLHFDENIRGLRHFRPGNDTRSGPLVRTAAIQLRGNIEGFRIEPVLARYEANLLRAGGNESRGFHRVVLENVNPGTQQSPEDPRLNLFNFTLSPLNREMTAPTENPGETP